MKWFILAFVILRFPNCRAQNAAAAEAKFRVVVRIGELRRDILIQKSAEQITLSTTIPHGPKLKAKMSARDYAIIRREARNLPQAAKLADECQRDFLAIVSEDFERISCLRAKTVTSKSYRDFLALLDWAIIKYRPPGK